MNAHLTPHPGVAQLRRDWLRLRTDEPALRARDVARRLGVSEGELIASRCCDDVIRLRQDWPALINALPGLGRVMALTRNAYCVHEKKGTYDHIDIHGALGLVLSGDIDLRLFLNHWVHGFAVRDETRGRTLRSLQFFDADGSAVHKIYAQPGTDETAWNRLVTRFTAALQSPLLEPAAIAPSWPTVDDDQIDIAALRAGWAALRDPHDFVGLLKRCRASRLQAMHLAGAAFTRRVDNSAMHRVLTQASHSSLPLMVFVASAGVVQIHTGPVRQVKRLGPWLNVLDDGFNLHLREDCIVESWVVRKPVPEGVVTSLELYARDGTLIAQVFGERKPGRAELEAWQALTESLPTTDEASTRADA